MSFVFLNCFNLFLREEHYTNKFCDFCNKRIILNNENHYYFKIFGLGKHDKKFICYKCFKDKSKSK